VGNTVESLKLEDVVRFEFGELEIRALLLDESEISFRFQTAEEKNAALQILRRRLLKSVRKIPESER
jgi:hypothetical protein